MPVYEYEPLDHDCLICNGRVEALQGANEPPLVYCPTCGLEVRRVISQSAFKLAGELPQMGKTGKQGFTTYKKAGNGVWEKTDGASGPDTIVRPPSDAF